MDKHVFQIKRKRLENLIADQITSMIGDRTFKECDPAGAASLAGAPAVDQRKADCSNPDSLIQ